VKTAKYGIALLIILQTSAVFAESRYTLDGIQDMIIAPAAVGVFAAPFFIDNPAASYDLNKGDVNGFDRPFMLPYNKPVDIVSDVGQYTLLVLPVLSLIGNIKDGKAWLTYGIMYAEAFFLTYGTKDIFKSAINRYRPYCYFDGSPGDKSSEYADSFPSGHTSLAFMSAGFLSSTFLTEYPDSKWRIPVVSISYTLAAGVAAGRILSGSHFLTDVIAGAAIGSLYGYLIPYLHLKKRGGERISLTPMPSGFIISMKVGK
jgi:undecaprenyl-diphosphatase